jgi:hypothetical protein
MTVAVLLVDITLVSTLISLIWRDAPAKPVTRLHRFSAFRSRTTARSSAPVVKNGFHGSLQNAKRDQHFLAGGRSRKWPTSGIGR